MARPSKPDGGSVTLSSPIRHRAEPLGPLRAIAYFRERFAMSPTLLKRIAPP